MFGEIFQLKCLGCGAVCTDKYPVCPDCLNSLPKYLHTCETCGAPVSVKAEVCGNCLSKRWHDRLYVGYRYTATLKKLLREIKFGYRINGFGLIEKLAVLPQGLDYDIVTAVPSHYTRHARRFAHPASKIAKCIAKQHGWKYEQLLTRTRKTEYQYKLKKTMREKNVRNAFSCKFALSNLKILLIDDIITTGSTITECCKVLRKSGASVIDVYVFTGGLR